MKIAPATRTRHGGFTLVEVMVALLVLSMGIVGIGTLQLASKRANLEAVQHMTAAQLASDLAERMRANPRGLSVYTNFGAGLTIGASAEAAVDCASGCAPEQMARYDLYRWSESLRGGTEILGGQRTGALVSALACLTGPDGGTGTYSIEIAWRGQYDLSDPSIGTCGSASGLYDSASGTNVRRRIVRLDTLIGVPL